MTYNIVYTFITMSMSITNVYIYRELHQTFGEDKENYIKEENKTRGAKKKRKECSY